MPVRPALVPTARPPGAPGSRTLAHATSAESDAGGNTVHCAGKMQPTIRLVFKAGSSQVISASVGGAAGGAGAVSVPAVPTAAAAARTPTPDAGSTAQVTSPAAAGEVTAAGDGEAASSTGKHDETAAAGCDDREPASTDGKAAGKKRKRKASEAAVPVFEPKPELMRNTIIEAAAKPGYSWIDTNFNNPTVEAFRKMRKVRCKKCTHRSVAGGVWYQNIAQHNEAKHKVGIKRHDESHLRMSLPQPAAQLTLYESGSAVHASAHAADFAASVTSQFIAHGVPPAAVGKLLSPALIRHAAMIGAAPSDTNIKQRDMPRAVALLHLGIRRVLEGRPLSLIVDEATTELIGKKQVVGVVAHSAFYPQPILLETYVEDASLNSDRLVELVRMTCANWDLDMDKQLVGIAGDNVAYNARAARVGGFDLFTCAAHSMDLVVDAVVDELGIVWFLQRLSTFVNAGGSPARRLRLGETTGRSYGDIDFSPTRWADIISVIDDVVANRAKLLIFVQTETGNSDDKRRLIAELRDDSLQFRLHIANVILSGTNGTLFTSIKAFQSDVDINIEHFVGKLDVTRRQLDHYQNPDRFDRYFGEFLDTVPAEKRDFVAEAQLAVAAACTKAAQKWDNRVIPSLAPLRIRALFSLARTPTVGDSDTIVNAVPLRGSAAARFEQDWSLFCTAYGANKLHPQGEAAKTALPAEGASARFWTGDGAAAFKVVSAVAQRYYSIPLSTAAVERVFSLMRLMEGNARRYAMAEPLFCNELFLRTNKEYLDEQVAQLDAMLQVDLASRTSTPRSSGGSAPAARSASGLAEAQVIARPIHPFFREGRAQVTQVGGAASGAAATNPGVERPHL